MAEIYHRVVVPTDPRMVFDAISTQQGLANFWTDQVVASQEVGSVAEFGFGPNREVVFRMRIDSLKSGELVEWHCLGDSDEWRDTKVRWELASGGERGTEVRFRHTNWRSTDGEFPSCSYTWAMILDRLGKYLGSGEGAPWFEKSRGYQTEGYE